MIKRSLIVFRIGHNIIRIATPSYAMSRFIITGLCQEYQMYESAFIILDLYTGV